MTRAHSIGWCVASVVLSLDPVRARSFTKNSVHIADCVYSMWTMLRFSSGAKLSFNGF
jgi:hypothetical protein